MLYKKQKLTTIAIFTLFFIILSSCSNQYLLSRDYGAELRETPRNLNQNQTTILFLIDGLSVPVFQSSLVHGNIAETQRFFSPKNGQNGKMLLGKAVFPTLTYPNITSILTAQPIHKHPIIGNKLYEKGQIINFEKPLNTQLLNKTLIGQTIFSRLAENYLKSVSLSHSFSSGANIGLGIDIEAGIAYLKEDFAKVDQKIIASLENLLTETEPTLWPHFIFVHLIGVDALSHKYGPYSPQAMQYLNQLDKELGRIYKILARTEQRGKKITSLLTSDHGFSEIKKFADLETFINKLNPKITVLNQSRIAALYLPKNQNIDQELQNLLKAQDGVEMVLSKREGKIFIESKNGQWILETRASLSCNSWDYKINLISPEKKETGFHCPEVFDQDTKNGFYPFFISNITSYFQSKSHPDLLVIANPNTSFNKQYMGDHGGPTLEETIVPVLTRNAEISPPSSVITTHKILNFLNLKSKFSKFSIITEGLPSISAFMPVTYISTQPNQQKKTTLNQIEVGTPLSSFIVKNESERVTTSWQPGLEIEWSQKWTNFFNSSLKYQLQYVNFLSDNSNLKYQSSYFLHGLAFGLGYRYGEKENLYLLGILKENYFLENPQELRKLWTPELALETKMRLYSFGLGDINLKGALGFLFSTGLREMIGIGIEAPIQTTDTMGAYFRLQHFNQNINQSHQSTFMYELVFTYGLSFLN